MKKNVMMLVVAIMAALGFSSCTTDADNFVSVINQATEEIKAAENEDAVKELGKKYEDEFKKACDSDAELTDAEKEKIYAALCDFIVAVSEKQAEFYGDDYKVTDFQLEKMKNRVLQVVNESKTLKELRQNMANAIL